MLICHGCLVIPLILSPSPPLFSLNHPCSFYDQEGHGSLREADLETYVYDLIGSLPALQVRTD